jgi:deoxyhypusine synthase
LHFNSASLVDAAKAYEQQLANGAKWWWAWLVLWVLPRLKIFSEIIRQDKVHIIFLRCQSWRRHYESCSSLSLWKSPNYRDLTSRWMGFTRKRFESCYWYLVTELLDVYKTHLQNLKDADDKGERYFPHEFMYKMLLSGVLRRVLWNRLKRQLMYGCREKIYHYCSRLKIVQWEIYLHHVIKGDLKLLRWNPGIMYGLFRLVSKK